MKAAILLAALAALATAAQGQGAIVGPDGKYLGTDDPNPYARDSIHNPYGRYGSKYSSDSIRNPYGEYGGKFSPKSPYNPFNATPPKVYAPGADRGRPFTVNPFAPDAVKPPAE